MAERIISTLHAVLADGTEVAQGQSVKLSAADEEQLDSEGALVPEVFESFAQFSQFKLDSYRAARGDVEAAQRLSGLAVKGIVDAHAHGLAVAAQEGGISDLSQPGGGENPYVAILREQKPNQDDTIALAEGDQGKAAQVLEAERTVSGGDPRKGVAKGLEAIIDPSA